MAAMEVHKKEVETKRAANASKAGKTFYKLTVRVSCPDTVALEALSGRLMCCLLGPQPFLPRSAAAAWWCRQCPGCMESCCAGSCIPLQQAPMPTAHIRHKSAAPSAADLHLLLNLCFTHCPCLCRTMGWACPTRISPICWAGCCQVQSTACSRHGASLAWAPRWPSSGAR